MSFKTQAEIWQYLLDGGKITLGPETAPFDYLAMNEGHLCYFEDGIANHSYYSFDAPKDWVPYQEPLKWYDNIPEQGVLCWVSEREERLKENTPSFIKDHVEEGFWDEECCMYWPYAQPLTKEEILKYCLEEQGD